MSPDKIRLQKYLSEQGIASRRKAEEYIAKGWVLVNGEAVKVQGFKVDPYRDKITLAPQADEEKKQFIYLLLNKPAGYVTNLPKKGEKEAKELLPGEVRGKVHAVGRLDKDSEGLLLFTNDGVLAHRLSSPVFEHEKEYEVTVDKSITPRVLDIYKKGLAIKGKRVKGIAVRQLRKNVYSFILREGKNRQIRRMLSNFGYEVLRLERTRIGNIKLDSMKSGAFRYIAKQDIFGLT